MLEYTENATPLCEGTLTPMVKSRGFRHLYSCCVIQVIEARITTLLLNILLPGPIQ